MLVLSCKQNGNKPPVRSVVLRQKGAERGIRLVDYQSLLTYLNSNEERAYSAAMA